MKPKTAVFFICVLLMLSGCSLKSNSSVIDETLTTELTYGGELQVALDDALRETGVIGVSAAIIVEDEGIWTGVSGESYPGRPVTPDMLFDMGSAGKMLMGPLMVKLAEDGLLALDDPISKYLPDFPYADGAITIRQLLNHTSGLFMMLDSPNAPFRQPYDQIDHEKWWTIDEIFTTLGGEPSFTPGEGYCYTQAGYQIATLIVEQVTGSTVAEQIHERLLFPLGIDGMFLDFSKPVPKKFEIAHPWVDVDHDGDYEDVNDRSRNWIASLSRIYYYTRAEDFSIWGHALFSGEVLKEKSMGAMLDFYRTDDWCGDEQFIKGYGMGVQDYNPGLTRGQPAWGHLGSIFGYRTFLAHLYQQGVTIVVMTNTDSDNALSIVNGLLDIVLNHAVRESEVSLPIDLEPVSQPPARARVVETFQKEALFCDHNASWETSIGPDDWIDISLDWVVATDEAKAEEIWQYHDHIITVDGQEIGDLESYTHAVEHYTVACADETLEIWAKGLSIYLPPLPAGSYEIKWYSEITNYFNNGWVDYKPGNYLELTTRLTVE
jgi:CubicO group peptidase (beta-lactamase class C family)